MNDPTAKSRTATLLIRWVARAWSIASVGLSLLMFIGSGLAEGFNSAQFAPRDWVGLFFFPFGVCLGMIVAWPVSARPVVCPRSSAGGLVPGVLAVIGQIA